MHQKALVNYQWTFEIFSYALDKWLGLWVLGALAVVSSGVLLFWALPRQWLRLKVHPAITYGALCLILSRHWVMPRPQLFAGFLFFAVLTITNLIRTRPDTKWLYALPVIFLLWANLHLTWFFGLVALTFFVFAHARRMPKLWFVYLICIAVIFCNPYGAELIRYGLSFNTRDQFLKITETKPAFYAPELYPFVLYCCAGLVLIIRSLKRFQSEWDRPIVALLALTLGLSIQRFVPFAVLGSWKAIGECLPRSAATSFTTAAVGTRGLMAAALISTVTWYQICPSETAAYAQLVRGSRAILELPSKRHVARLFNDPIIGSWMVYARTGKPLLDNHFDLYDKQLCVDVYSIIAADPGWRGMLDKYRFDAVLIRKRSNMYEDLNRDPQGWRKVAEDDVIAYWERPTVRADLPVRPRR